jgi:GAF domain-containing protein
MVGGNRGDLICVAGHAQSYAVVPLLAEGALIGSLNLCASQPGGPAAQDLVVAGEIAAQLAIALQQARVLV